jgi:hypothetical protein
MPQRFPKTRLNHIHYKLYEEVLILVNQNRSRWRGDELSLQSRHKDRSQRMANGKFCVSNLLKEGLESLR